MLSGRPHVVPRRVPQATSVVVKEIYLSLQGESSHQGLLCSFVRLTGCHLRCRYCDSAFAFQGGERLEVDEVVRRVAALGAKRVELTGGEPLLQPGVYPLMEALVSLGYVVLLETSGAIDVRLVPPEVHKIVDLKTPSSGEADRHDPAVYASMSPRDELKGPFAVLFSTVFGALNPRDLAEWIVADRLPVRFQLQQHKYLWAPDARGV